MSAKNIFREGIVFVLVALPISIVTLLLIHSSRVMIVIDRSPLSSIPRTTSFIVGVVMLVTGGYLLRKWGWAHVMDFSKPFSSRFDYLIFTGLTSFWAFLLALSFMLMWPFLKQILVFLIHLFS